MLKGLTIWMWFVECELLSWHSRLMWLRSGTHTMDSQKKESVAYGSCCFPKSAVWFLALLVRSAIIATVINSDFQNLSKLDEGVAPWKSYSGRGKPSNISGSISGIGRLYCWEAMAIKSFIYECLFICALANVSTRECILEKEKATGTTFTAQVHGKR